MLTVRKTRWNLGVMLWEGESEPSLCYQARKKLVIGSDTMMQWLRWGSKCVLVGRTTSINDSIWSCLCQGNVGVWGLSLITVFFWSMKQLWQTLYYFTHMWRKKSLFYLLFQIHFLNRFFIISLYLYILFLLFYPI